MDEVNTALLALAVLINGFLAWKAAVISAEVSRKTDEILMVTRTTLDAVAELLKRTKSA